MGGKGKMRALGNGYEWEDVEYVKGRQVINIHEESGIRGAGWDDWVGRRCLDNIHIFTSLHLPAHASNYLETPPWQSGVIKG